MKFKLMTALLSLVLSGCATMPTQDEINNADYGSYPANYKQIVKSYNQRLLKDPSSAIYGSISSPIKYMLGNRIDGVRYGYLVCASVNAKNSFGGYTGFSTNAYFIRNDQMIQYVGKGEWWGRNICGY